MGKGAGVSDDHILIITDELDQLPECCFRWRQLACQWWADMELFKAERDIARAMVAARDQEIVRMRKRQMADCEHNKIFGICSFHNVMCLHGVGCGKDCDCNEAD